MKKMFLLAGLLLPALCQAQNYSISWYKIAGGGGASSGGPFSLQGTIGQAEAGTTMTGGAFSLTGGFWSLVGVVQTAGLPNLTIGYAGNAIVISWADTGSYTLQQNAAIGGAGGWTASGLTIGTSNGTNSVTISQPAGNLFFRLSNH